MNDLVNLLKSRISDIDLLISAKINKIQNKKQYNIDCSPTACESPKFFNQAGKPKASFSSSSQFQKQNQHSEDVITQKQVDREMNDLEFLIKKRQKLRSNKQAKLFNALGNITFINQKQIEQFYFISVQLFEQFDSQFSKYRYQGSFLSVSMQQNLKKIYSFFFLKHDSQQHNKQLITEISTIQMRSLSPCFFLGWIKKWSTRVLQSLLNLNEDVSEFKIGVKLDLKKIKDIILNKNLALDIFTKRNTNKSIDFISKQRSPNTSPKKTTKQSALKTQDNLENKIIKLISSLSLNDGSSQIPLSSKQMVYSCILEQLKTYYKNFPIQDIDNGYLKNLRKNGRKQDILLGDGSKNCLESLIQGKNAHIKSTISQFNCQYGKFIQAKREKSLKNRKNQKSLHSQSNLNLQKLNKVQNKNFAKDISIKDPNNFTTFNSKLLTPSNHPIQSYRKKANSDLNKEEEVFQRLDQKINSYKRNKKQLYQDFSGPIQEIINMNNIFKRQISQEFGESNYKSEILKKIGRKIEGEDQKQTNKNLQYFQKLLANNKNDFVATEQSSSPERKIAKLPKLTNKKQSIKMRLKRIQTSQTDQRLNCSQLSPLKLKPSFKQQSSPHLATQIFICKRNYSKIHTQNMNKRLLSQISEKQIIQDGETEENLRAKSNFALKEKSSVGYKKPSLHMIKLIKNKIYPKGQCEQNQNIKLTSKNHRRKSQKIQKNIFSEESLSFGKQTHKDQFIEYLKNLRKQKLESRTFQQINQKQKLKLIKPKIS